ncbi:hypothetical protein DR864_11110 [Runella rosea]|uniref:Uncharacterized protein n=1 Tax=Runella rosea TaxID=2259595 RepID=A0A344THY2_9BACT|nr:hypothetical protein [Runella rosea]AXE18253.1 hypothetical protein DR864_11110 [Runella rosea]
MKKNKIENHVKYGLEAIDDGLTIEVNLKKLLLMYKTFEELISFFHQPGHYTKIEDIEEFMGNKNTGMFSILSQIYYQDFDGILPQNIKDILESDEFYNPVKQYYKTKSDLHPSDGYPT